AMFAEGFHSLADTCNQLFILLGLRLSRRKATPLHPFGFGKERYFWTFVVALSVFFLGAAFSVYEGVEKVLHPHPIENIKWVVSVLIFSLVFEGYAGFVGLTEYRHAFGRRSFLKTARETKDLGLIAMIIEDSLAGVGILIAMIGIGLTLWSGIDAIDGIASILIGLLLAGVAYFLAAESKGLLIGEGASGSDLKKIRTAVASVPQVDEMIELLTLHMGPEDLLVNLSLKFRPGLSTEELEKAIDAVETAIQSQVPAAKRIFIEAESLKGGASQG
ncbi:MAG TPA: cation diffusion facilitator family transporter, partial [Nitrospiria bacterium]|nr:cation diffusion facilitator family transporter [Nitrospiria bacterium]